MMFAEFQQAARQIYEEARKEGRLIENPLERDLRAMTLQAGARETIYGNIAAESEPSSRAAMFTRNNIDTRFGQEEWELLNQAEERLAKERLISLDVEVGDGSEGVTARLIVPERFAHVAYGGRKLFKPCLTPAEQPSHNVIIFADEEFERNKEKPLPQKSITIRLAHSETGELVKVIRNSDYTGEGWKKGVFAGEDWRVKRDGKAIFLHAGCRQDRLVRAWGVDPKPQVQNSLFVALSANGKTSLVCRVLAKKEGEESWLVQDDGGTLRDDGSFTGFEAGGLFVKTEKLNPGDQMEIYYAILRRSRSYLENVYVGKDGRIDFYNLQRTSNGRAIVEREDLMHSSQEISVEKIHNLFIITRENIFPAMAQLTPEQATAWMIQARSTESSAGDPTQAGKIISQFFFDPFVAGNKTEHANLFYEIIKRNGINCYLLNTGGIGEGEAYQKITLSETLGILDSTLRGGLVDWIEAEGTGLIVPASVRTVDSSFFHPQKSFPPEVFAQKQRDFNQQGTEILEQYPGLNKKVREVFLR